MCLGKYLRMAPKALGLYILSGDLDVAPCVLALAWLCPGSATALAAICGINQ